ncbi:MAG: squalene/phytoene synthase family protein, partial [Caulobacteraceae bacterium]|nr:squalene/phytoene synthase family protein [Caulobacteraceae bacterium]
EAGLEKAERRRQLDAWRADLDALYAGAPATLSVFLAEPVRRFGLRKEDFLAVIDGMQMDVDADIVAPTYDVLDLYCDRVASAVGRLSVCIFGMDTQPGLDLAFELGRALQLTNILRDVDEDAGIGRLYMPLEALEAAGITAREPLAVVADPRLDAACRWVAAKARQHYAKANAIMAARPRGRLIAPRVMGAVYGEILDRMETIGWALPRDRVSLSKPRLIWLLIRRGFLA